MTTLGVFHDQFYNAINVLPQSSYKATTQNGGTLTAANLTGAGDVYLAASGQTAAQALTTDTAANIISQLQFALSSAVPPSPPGVTNLTNLTYTLTLINNNTSSGAITLTGGTGVTITGTNTLSITTSRIFVVTVTSPSTVTFQNVGSATP